mgnify:CR=1 FL=1
MVKEILIYTPIYSYSAEAFIKAMEESKNGDIVVRVNTPGGSPEDGWGMIAKFAEHKGKKLVKVDGRADSMGAYFLAYADDAEALDVSRAVIHRAAYPEYIEKNPNYMTKSMWEQMDQINAKLRAALEAKIDVKKFEKLKKVSMDDIFSNDNRLDVVLTAEDMKKIGLVNRVVTITPDKKAEIETMMFQIAAHSTGIPTPQTETEVKPLNTKTMTSEKLKAENPAAYNEILEAGIAAGVAKEKDRTGAWLAFIKIDAESVEKGIKEGKDLSQTAMAEFTAKAISAKTLTAVAADAADPLKTDEVKTKEQEKEKTLSAFEKEVLDGVKKNATA